MSLTPTYSPTDPLYVQQSHFLAIGRLGYNHADKLGIERIWSQYTGQGVSFGVWDDGIQRTQVDLASNYDANQHVYVLGALNNGQPVSNTSAHGTAVAGLLAAANNTQGGVGVAFNSSLTGVTIFGGSDDLNAQSFRYLQTLHALRDFDVTNHSYGSVPAFDAAIGVINFQEAAQHGRGGLGTLNVKSAGNEKYDGGGNALSASRFTLTVNTTTLGTAFHTTDYSTYGSHIFISAPAASVTTDLTGQPGYNGLSNNDYTNRFGGSSAAAPMVGGVIALMLEANPELGWRDVYDILSLSAVATNSLYGSAQANEQFAWKWNTSNDWNGGGLHVSEDYGFGVVNAFNAVRMAEVWSLPNVAAQTSVNELSATSRQQNLNLTIPDRSTLPYTLNLAENISVEHVSLTIGLTQPDLSELNITLVSPTGTRLSVYDGSVGETDDDQTLLYTFGLTGFRGESSAGNWQLDIQDTAAVRNGSLNEVALTAWGSAVSQNNVYYYTDEVFATFSLAGQSARLGLTDQNGGQDWVNAAALYDDLTINLNNGAYSSARGQNFIQIDANQQTLIENVISGDGFDTLIGNTFDNSFWGGRGNDSINGNDGVDTAIFSGQANRYSVSMMPQSMTVNDFSLTGDGVDTLQNIERLQFGDQVVDMRAFSGVASLTAEDLTLLTNMYIAYFNRAPDAEGLFYWGTRLSQGMTFENIAGSFFEQPETIAQYANSTGTVDFISVVYQNLLGRTPDQAGLNYWENSLDSGSISKPTYMLAVIYGAYAPTGGADDAIYLTNKTNIGSYFSTIQGMSNGTHAKQVMQWFDGSDESVLLAKQASDAFLYLAQQAPATDQLLMSLEGVVNNPFAGFA
jgi:subtilisin-like proprotein convertase family protein